MRWRRSKPPYAIEWDAGHGWAVYDSRGRFVHLSATLLQAENWCTRGKR